MVGEGSPFWFSLNCSCQTDNNHFKCYILIFHITNFFEFFMTRSRVTCTISLFFLEKKSEIWNAFTLFEKWKVKQKCLSLFSRNEKWNYFSFHSFREWKVKWKCLKIEIENEKWNENASRSRLRSEMSTKFSRILEKRDSRRLPIQGQVGRV